MDPLAIAADLLSHDPRVVLAYAFGSVPEGRAHSESDLDLAVLLDWQRVPSRAERADVQLELIEQLMRALARNEIDLVVINDAPPLLTRHVTRAGRLLCARDREEVHALTRDAQLRAADIEPFIRKGRARLLNRLRS